MDDAIIFAGIFAGEGAVELTWDVGARCDCYSLDTRQPEWGHVACGGLGCIYTPRAGTVRGLFRSQSRHVSRRVSGEHDLADATLTLPTTVKPNYVDERIRDRFRVVRSADDRLEDLVFYPAAEPVPFIFDGVQHAWRVRVLGLKNVATRTLPQP